MAFFLIEGPRRRDNRWGSFRSGAIWWPPTQCGHDSQIVSFMAPILTSVSLLPSSGVVTSLLDVGQR